jgi:hypothetical protein
MSITGARSYLRARAKAVGLKEWPDGFNFQNIPSTIVNGSFHVLSEAGTGTKLNQNDQEIAFVHILRVLFKGYRDPGAAIDSAIKITEDLIKETVAPKNRLTQSDGIKNIALEGFRFDELEQSNDNIVVASITFRVISTLGL